jgi:hypothetical protein
MNYKKLVREIYPDACLYHDLDDRAVNSAARYTIVISPGSNGKTIIKFYPDDDWSVTKTYLLFFENWHRNYNNIWKNAYEKIQNDILDKLVQ